MGTSAAIAVKFRATKVQVRVGVLYKFCKEDSGGQKSTRAGVPVGSADDAWRARSTKRTRQQPGEGTEYESP